MSQSQAPIVSPKTQPEPFLSINQALELMPGITRQHLAQLRYVGAGPRYYKPTARTVFYKASDIFEWLESSARTSTAEEQR
jgi:hypothetical protein